MTTLGRVAVLLVAAGLTNHGDGQGPQDKKAPQAVVEISTKGFTYRPGLPMRFRALLVNSGTVPFYVSNSFAEAGGGIAGFHYEVKQLTGRRPRVQCGIAGDRLFREERTPQQILQEDYFVLFPKHVIGSELRVEHFCKEGPYRGRYRISVSYSAQDLNIRKIAAIPDLDYPVLQGQTEKASATIDVR